MSKDSIFYSKAMPWQYAYSSTVNVFNIYDISGSFCYELCARSLCDFV